ncbi:hypothetical protein C7B67_26605 [filamentous cyanobacterium Phorm 6]|nr:hypothetical protein C7B67_26605 [filamentous cyanobacterium Phorm 6]
MSALLKSSTRPRLKDRDYKVVKKWNQESHRAFGPTLIEATSAWGFPSARAKERKFGKNNA